MKPVFLESTARQGIKAVSLYLLLGLLATPLGAQVADTWYSPDYGSYFSNGNLPQPDATNFVNEGTWDILTPAPFQTSDTLNYTNSGVMTGTYGWDFGFYPSSMGFAGWSANFYNDISGVISAVDSYALIAHIYEVQESYLLVSATNIINKGLLSAGAGGEIVLSGSNIDLSYGQGVEITPISENFGYIYTYNGQVPSPGYNLNNTNFFPAPGILDEYWEATNGTFFVTGSPWGGSTVGQFTGTGIGMPCNTTGNTSIGPLTPNVIDSFATNVGLLTLIVTNVGGSTTPVSFYTNEIHQGVFVYTGTSNNVTGAIRFTPSDESSNYFKIVAIQLLQEITNSITDQLEGGYIYVLDSFAASTNHFLAVNVNPDPNAFCNASTFRPTAVEVARTAPTNFLSGTNYGVVPPSNFFYDGVGGTVINNGVQQQYSAWTNYMVNGGSCATYSALIENQTQQVPPGGSVTNLPGRVHIYANTLNLNQAHVRAEGQIVVQASNLVGSTNASMDCQNLSFNLASTNGQLNFASLAPTNIYRLNGTMSMWTAVWSNFFTVVTANYTTNNSTNATWVLQPLTNTIRVDLAITVVDAGGLVEALPVTVQDLQLHGTNITVTDSANVNNSFLLDGISATLNGRLILSGQVQNWTSANAPSLRYFTNNGSLSIPNNAHFGDTGSPTNYLSFVNNGTISAGGVGINSVNFQNHGYLSSQYSTFNLTTQTGQVANATINSVGYVNLIPVGGPINLNARSLGITNSTIEAYGAINFTVTNVLTDGGSSTANLFLCGGGFNLNSPAPASGDLLGTTIFDTATNSVQVNHKWAGVNSGAVAAGFTNHTALGRLVLYPLGPQTTGYKPKFAFNTTSGNNALYVNHLDLSALVDFTNELSIASGMTIYYASVNLNPNVITNGFPSAEAYLNNNPNLFGSRLQWVSGVVGLSASKDNVYSTKLRLLPISNPAFGLGSGFQLAENIMPAQTNITEASSDLVHWVPISTNIGTYLNYGPITVGDPNATNYPMRFYRFRTQP